jgi:hypothetical protein
MLASVSELFSWRACRFRSRAHLELEVIALRHQLAVLRRQRRGRISLSSVDRLIWGLALPGVAALPQRDGASEAGHGRPVAPGRLSTLLALAVTVRTPVNQSRGS